MSICSRIILLALIITVGCQPKSTEKTNKLVQLVSLDPGHFHAALLQKSMYPDIDSVVYVYSPGGEDLKMHLERVNAYNTRTENPTNWIEEVYTGNDFLEKMVAEKHGNVVVISGNNQRKAEYINQSLEAGFHVLADKPMAVTTADFKSLQKAFQTADEKNIRLYDIMTERYEITTMLQRALSQIPEVFGTLEKGTPDNPAITKESVHYFFKYVSGKILTRPAWFFDTDQQGAGIVDVTTHLVDLVQWECFPEQTIDYQQDIQITSAYTWSTPIEKSQFMGITKLADFPSYLKKNIQDTTLMVSSNGEINYQIKGVNARTSVIWKYKAPEGAGDTHYSIMRGSKSNLIIQQGEKENFKPVLYLTPVANDPDFEKTLVEKFKTVEAQYPGIALEKNDKGWTIIIPDHYKEGHEAHFGRVVEKFIGYLKEDNMPAWETPNTIAKYYTTTKALEVAVTR